MKYLILGAGPGSMGEAIAARLLKEEDTQIFITDQNLDNVDKTWKKLKPHSYGANLQWFLPEGRGLDVVRQKDPLPLFFKSFDIVISAIPASLNPIVAEAVLLANEICVKNNSGKTHYLDLGGVLEITRKIVCGNLADRAKELEISVVTDGGFGPGLDDAFVMSLLKKFDPEKPLESMIVEIGGLPYKHDEPPFYKRLFNLKGLEEMYYNRPLVLAGGKPRTIAPLLKCKPLQARDFDLYFGTKDVVMFESAITDGLGAMPYYLEGQVLKYQERTIRYPGHYDIVKKIPRENFTESFGEWLSKYPVQTEDICVLRVTAVGQSLETGKRVKIEKLMHTRSDKNFNSMQKATGFTLAMMAKLTAQGKARKGAYPAGIALDPEDVLDALKNDFYIYERTTTLK